MKRFLCVLCAVFMIIGFAGGVVGCKDKGGTATEETETVAVPAEVGEEAAPPAATGPAEEAAPAPSEAQSQGEQEKGGDASQ